MKGVASSVTKTIAGVIALGKYNTDLTGGVFFSEDSTNLKAFECEQEEKRRPVVVDGVSL